jgi:hypothetical protein
LTHKKEAVYTKMLNIIVSLCQRYEIVINVKKTMSDFEKGLIPALKKWTVVVDIDGCLFHLSQASFRFISKHNLTVCIFTYILLHF